MDSRVKVQIEQKKIQVLYQQMQEALLGNLGVGICTTLILISAISWKILVVWNFLLMLVLALRWMSRCAFEARSEQHIQASRWIKRYGIGTLLTGLLWGLLAVYVVLDGQVAFVAIMLMIMAGLIAGTVTTCFVYERIFFSFSLPALIPVVIALFMTGELHFMLLAILIVIYLGLSLNSVRRLNQVLLQSLHYSYKNHQLLNDLSAEQELVTTLNQQLQDDIQMQETLRLEREAVIEKLQDALDNVKTLSGMIPICASCKSVRNDQGYWSRIESFLLDRGDLDLTHSICPTCRDKLYSELHEPKKVSSESDTED